MREELKIPEIIDIEVRQTAHNKRSSFEAAYGMHDPIISWVLREGSLIFI